MFSDLKFAIRSLRRSPGFTVIAVMTLALGIGATTAVFSVLSSMLIRPLPYKEPDRLVAVTSINKSQGVDLSRVGLSDYLEWKRDGIFERIAVSYNFDAYLGDDSAEPQEVLGTSVSSDYFALLGVAAKLGRTFQADDYRPTSNDVRTCIISERLWRQRYSRDPQIIGQRIRLFGRASHIIVGVMPRGALLPDDRDIVLPMLETPDSAVNIQRTRSMMWLDVLARLKPGAGLEQTNAELAAWSKRLERTDPEYFSGWRNRAVPLQTALVGMPLRTSLLTALGAVGLVLLIAAINVASLQLARGVARVHETAVRLSMGASSWRVLRLLLAESLVLACMGSALGVLLAVWGTDWLAMLLLPGLPGWARIGVSGEVLAFALTITLLTAVLCGLAPALQTTRIAVSSQLKESAHQVASGLRGQRLRKALVVAEVALSLMLLVGAGLMIRSFALAQRPDTGFPVERLLTVDLRLPKHRYQNDAAIVSFYRQLMERVKAVPGVATAAVTSITPASGQDRHVEVFLQKDAGSSVDSNFHARLNGISPDFFATMGMKLISGRGFSEQDIGRNSPIIVSETLARRMFPNGDSVGKQVRWFIGLQASDGQTREIVGVVKNVRYFGREDELGDLVYSADVWPWMMLTVRTRSAPTAISSAVRAQIKSLDREVAVSNVRTMSEIVERSIAPRRSNTLLIAGFSAIAMALAALGLYGVLSYMVAQRVREIGIRTALGALPRHILMTVAGQGLRLVLIGVVCGLLGALALTRLLRSLLYGVSATDPITIVAAAVFLIIVASVACYLPARRAARIDPLLALRHE